MYPSKRIPDNHGVQMSLNECINFDLGNNLTGFIGSKKNIVMKSIKLIVSVVLTASMTAFVQGVPLEGRVVTKNSHELSPLDFKHQRFNKSKLTQKSLPVKNAGRVRHLAPAYKNRYGVLPSEKGRKNRVASRFSGMSGPNFPHSRFQHRPKVVLKH
jgi:hypothetical protein